MKAIPWLKTLYLHYKYNGDSLYVTQKYLINHSFIHSFIHSPNIYQALSRYNVVMYCNVQLYKILWFKKLHLVRKIDGFKSQNFRANRAKGTLDKDNEP